MKIGLSAHSIVIFSLGIETRKRTWKDFKSYGEVEIVGSVALNSSAVSIWSYHKFSHNIF